MTGVQTCALPISPDRGGGKDPDNPDAIYHVAMYSGNGVMIEAFDSTTPVRITPVRLDTDYWGAPLPRPTAVIRIAEGSGDDFVLASARMTLGRARYRDLRNRLAFKRIGACRKCGLFRDGCGQGSQISQPL